jgi:hypothetical protein
MRSSILARDSWLPATDYPRAFVSFPRIAGSGNEIAFHIDCMAKPPALNIYVTILYFLGLEACYKK